MSARGSRDGWMIVVHRYVGLIIGAWMCAVGASGAILAYYREIETWLDPKLFLMETPGPRHPDLDRMVAAVRAAYPDRFILYIDRHGLSLNETYPFILSGPLPMIPEGPDLSSIGNYEAATDLQIFVNPVTAEIVGARSHWTFINLLRDFHRELFAPLFGRKVLGALGILVVLTSIFGGVLWWRDARQNMKRALVMRSSSSMPRLIRDGHTVFGIYAVVIIGWLGLSATLICYGGSIREFADWVLRGGRPAQVFEGSALASSPAPAAAATFVSLNAARDVALTDHPNSDVVLIRMPKTPAARISFRLYPLDEPVTIYTRQVYVDAGTGEIAGRFDPKRQPWSDSLFGLWLIWFHNGTMLGDFGRALNIFAGITLASLFPTGLYIWWKKRPSRRRRTDLSPVGDPRYRRISQPAE
ncbi:MAG: PepSY domain-containing protein [Alphaproteobacteria bacterium]|nr:PepSY domain-containing protein [Alphaproteobacteria bacterium]